MLFGVLLGVFLLALIVITVVYVRRKLADKREVGTERSRSHAGRGYQGGTEPEQGVLDKP